jgi:hypothetical protein
LTSLHRIFDLRLTPFQPGERRPTQASKSVSTVYLPLGKSETVETVRLQKRNLNHPVETG